MLQLAPATFELKEGTRTICTPEYVADEGSVISYAVEHGPEYTVTPSHVEFRLKVSNRTSKILKLAGTMFKFVVDGNEVALDGTQQAVIDAALRPNDTQEFSIVGPEWSTLPKHALISFNIFNVPTEFDDAGNVTKTENFDWSFDYNVTTVEKTGQVTYQTMYMTAAEASNRCSSPVNAEHAASEEVMPPAAR